MMRAVSVGQKDKMYTRLSQKATKVYYKQIMEEAITETDRLRKQYPEISVYELIYAQLVDLKERLIVHNQVYSKAALYQRYSFGGIVAKNFDLETDEYAQKISDCYGGAFDYHCLQEIMR